MDEQIRKLAEAIYKIRNKEKMIRVIYEQGTGTNRAYLETLIQAARENTQRELKAQVKQGYLKEAETSNILKELDTIASIINPEPKILIATFPEYIANEFYIHSVAIDLHDTNRQAKT